MHKNYQELGFMCMAAWDMDQIDPMHHMGLPRTFIQAAPKKDHKQALSACKLSVSRLETYWSTGRDIRRT
jgi:hypothetical protein